MTLRDQLDDDLSVFLNTDDFAEAAKFQPRGVAPGFDIVVLRGDAQPNVSGDPVRGPSQVVRLLADLAVIRAGIAALEGTARDPVEGDRVVVGADIVTLQAPEREASDSNAVHLFGTIATVTALTALRRA